MKKFLFLLFFLLSASMLRGGEVDENQAKAIARNFFLSRNRQVEAGSLRLLEGKAALTRSASGQAPAYHIINHTGGGFVIVAGETSMEPVLAYSLDRTFSLDDAPAGVLATLEEYRKAAETARSTDRVPSLAIRSRWEAATLPPGQPGTRAQTSTGGNAVVQLETATWDQGSPYNLLCPVVGGGRSVTGCVATAIAIIMRYWRYPEKGTGHIPDYRYEYNGRTIFMEGYDLGEVYDYDKMPLTGSGYVTEASRRMVATLMRDCGYMTKMQYSPGGSGAYSEDVLPALKQYMGYDEGARFAYRLFYSTAQWIDLIERELLEGRPVYLSGTSPEGGHAFVADGFDDRHYVHFNWGWSGTCNGYFSMAPYGYAAESRDPEFFENQDIILGLRPAAESPQAAVPEIWWYPFNTEYLAIEPEERPVPGSTFELYPRWLSSWSHEWTEEEFGFYTADGEDIPRDYEVIAAHVDRTGTVKDFICAPERLSTARRLSCQLKSAVEVGDEIRLFCRAPGTESWLPVHSHEDFANGHILLKDAVSTQAATSVRIFREQVYVLEAEKYSKILEISVPVGVRASLYTEGGTLVSCLGETGRRSEALQYSPDGRTVKVVLNELSAGRYKMVLDRTFDPAVFEFTVE